MMHRQVTEHCFLKVQFESTVTWQLLSDYLRCTPQFHGVPRYDCVIIRTVDRVIFGRLLFIFTIVEGSTTYPLALIHPYDAASGPQRRKDRDLGLIRVRARPRASAEFISVHSIIRGAYLVQDGADVNDFFVVDVVDTDMFLRIKKIRS